MYLNFLDIVSQLQKSYEIDLRSIGNQPAIIDVVFLNFCPVSWSEYTLYIGDSSMLHPSPDKPIMLLTTEDDEVESILPTGSNIGIIPENEVKDIYEMAMDIFHRDLKSQVILYQISTEALHGKDIVSLINTAASLIGNALILVDTNMKVLVHSTIFEIEDLLWAENIKLGHYTQEFIHKLKNNKEMREWTKSGDESKIIAFEGDKQPKLVTRITQNGHVIGALVMIAHHTPINHSHVKQLPKIGRILFDTFNSIFGDERYMSYHSTILYHLLSGDDISDTLDLSTLTGADFPNQMIAVVARFIRRIENRYFKRSVGIELERIFPNGYPVQYKNYVAVVVPSISKEQWNELNKLVKAEEINIGISWPFTNILEFRKYFYQAVTSIKLAHNSKNMILNYTDYAFYDLLSNYNGRIALNNFCHPSLELLKQYDKDNNTELYKTFETYLKCNMKLGDTAKELYLHRNTVTYRINRIVEITGIDLNDVSIITSLVDSYRIQNFLESEKHL
jgi:hypothetical protein